MRVHRDNQEDGEEDVDLEYFLQSCLEDCWGCDGGAVEQADHRANNAIESIVRLIIVLSKKKILSAEDIKNIVADRADYTITLTE